jgi:hypothetical protein
MKAILDVVQILYALVVTLVIGVEGSGPGPDKKKAVVDKILAIIDEPGGIDVPSWLRGILPTVLPILVDLVVAQLNRLGFLKPSSDS